MPSRLRSTVVTHSYSLSTQGRSTAGALGIATALVDIRCLPDRRLPERQHVAQERVEIVVTQLHGRHERPGLDGVRVLEPQAKVFFVVCDRPRDESLTAHQVG